ncbi:hypothetical protein SCLCIDRAFT_29388 [Scleroderma citrinum Foug A]|uniref:Uncharacterized protein n=1 Tax=Scleroderma citrinum Foug A TaxID=1036808 RepID=A0A0C3DK09_9AGAM|nr:hypothetical protein SCLCIDRAFT_29388 [Scleroderma citrinum Foug A]
MPPLNNTSQQYTAVNVPNTANNVLAVPLPMGADTSLNIPGAANALFNITITINNDLTTLNILSTNAAPASLQLSTMPLLLYALFNGPVTINNSADLNTLTANAAPATLPPLTTPLLLLTKHCSRNSLTVDEATIGLHGPFQVLSFADIVFRSSKAINNTTIALLRRPKVDTKDKPPHRDSEGKGEVGLD